MAVALQNGVNFFDTADVYGSGHSEELIGQALQPCRNRVMISTKAGWDFYHGPVRRNFSYSYLSFALQESLRRLRTDHVDLFLLHNPPMQLVNDENLLLYLRKFQTEGRILHYGVSVHGPREALVWITQTDVHVVQLAFSLLDQRAARDLFAAPQIHGRMIIAREPLACGMLADKYSGDIKFPKTDHRRRWPREKIALDLAKIVKIKNVLGAVDAPLARIALEFVLSFRQVSVVVAGMKTVQQVHDNLGALMKNDLAPSLIERLRLLHDTEEIFSQGIYKN